MRGGTFMNKYPKIQTVYKRDPDNNYKTLLEGEFSEPAFKFLRDNMWYYTEKIDGTNTRIVWKDERVIYRGKSNASQMPTFLLERLQEIFGGENELKLKEVFGNTNVCLYGESYGHKIQKAGDNYNSDGNDFVLFDIKIGDYWLERDNIEGIAKALGIDVVPMIGKGTLKEMVEIARNGFKSQWGDFVAEGIVAKPAMELRTRRGDRIMTKIKYRDFRH